MGQIDSKDNLIRIVNQYKNLVFSICLKMTGDYFTAEDITQDTFVSVYGHMGDFDGVNEKAWICRIASNRCVDYMRGAARKSVPTDDEAIPNMIDSVNDPQKLFATRSVMSEVENSCKKLPPPYNEVAYCYFIEGHTAKEIAASRSMNLKTVQTQIYRAREMLKKYVRREDLMS